MSVLSHTLRLVWRLALIAATAALLTACRSGGSSPQSADGPGFAQNGQFQSGGLIGRRAPKVKVALLLPTTAKGNTSQLAKALKQAGELALFDFDNPTVTLVEKDTKGTPEGAAAAAREAVAEGVELIVGPLFAKSVEATAPVARRAGVPVIAFSSDKTVAGDGVYLLSFLAGYDVDRIVSYTVSQGRRSFVALIPNSAYGKVVESAFRHAVTQTGAELVALEHYPLEANGMLEPTRKIADLVKDENTQVDAIFIPAGPETLPTISALMPYFEIDTSALKLVGTGRWDYAGIGREKPLIGGWLPGPEPKDWRAFTQRYVQTYGKSPPRLASLAYDAVSLAVSLSTRPQGSRYTPDQLTRPSGFAGVDGLFRLLPDGTSERGLAILEVRRFGTRVVDPAPSVFGRAQF